MDKRNILLILALLLLCYLFVFETDRLFEINLSPSFSPSSGGYLAGARGNDISCSDGSEASVACVYPNKPLCQCTDNSAECGCI